MLVPIVRCKRLQNRKSDFAHIEKVHDKSYDARRGERQRERESNVH